MLYQDLIEKHSIDVSLLQESTQRAIKKYVKIKNLKYPNKEDELERLDELIWNDILDYLNEDILDDETENKKIVETEPQKPNEMKKEEDVKKEETKEKIDTSDYPTAVKETVKEKKTETETIEEKPQQKEMSFLDKMLGRK